MATKDSNFKTVFIEIPKRISFAKLKREGVLAYDTDNLYTQRTELLVKGSATGKAVHSLYKKHINGEGFRDPSLGTLVINEKKETMNTILRKISKDFAYHWGFALHFNMDVLGQIHEITHIPFKWVRHADEDNKKHAGEFAIYEDWEAQKYKSFNNKKVDWIHPFDPDPVAIEEQIFKSGEDEKTPGTVEDWKGQLLYFTAEGGMGGGYVESPFDCSMLDLETDQELALFRNSTVLSSFLASYAAIFKQKFEDPKESKEMDANLLKVQGGRHSGKIIKIEGTGDDDNAVRFEKLETIDHDGLFSETEGSTQTNIRKAVQAPLELSGDDFAGGFDSGRVEDQRRFYNSQTDDERTALEEVFEIITPNLAIPMVPTTHEIKPLFEEELQEEPTPEGEEKTQTTEGSPDPVIIEEDVDVQGLALNGAQISSLKEVILAVGDGSLSKGPAKELIKASFPALSLDQVNKMVDPIDVKIKTE